MQARKIISILTHYIIDSWLGQIQSPVVQPALRCDYDGVVPGISIFSFKKVILKNIYTQLEKKRGV